MQKRRKHKKQWNIRKGKRKMGLDRRKIEKGERTTNMERKSLNEKVTNKSKVKGKRIKKAT